MSILYASINLVSSISRHPDIPGFLIGFKAYDNRDPLLDLAVWL